MTDVHDQTVDLLNCWHAGDRAALLQLVERNREWILRKVRAGRSPALEKDAETVDDIQDLMVDVLEYSPRFVSANGRQFRGLLARMIANRLADRARGLNRRAGTMESLGAESRISLDPALRPRQPTQPEDAAARSEEIAWMHLGLEFLSADDRDVVCRRQLAEQSFAEIGSARGEAPDAVRMRFRRGLLRLAGIVQSLQSGSVDTLLEGGG